MHTNRRWPGCPSTCRCYGKGEQEAFLLASSSGRTYHVRSGERLDDVTHSSFGNGGNWVGGDIDKDCHNPRLVSGGNHIPRPERYKKQGEKVVRTLAVTKGRERKGASRGEKGN